MRKTLIVILFQFQYQFMSHTQRSQVRTYLHTRDDYDVRVNAKFINLQFQSGKTTIANFLSDATETFGGDYHPTQGVRIVEFECAASPSKGVKIEVELWDCSGDLKYIIYLHLHVFPMIYVQYKLQYMNVL